MAEAITPSVAKDGSQPGTDVASRSGYVRNRPNPVIPELSKSTANALHYMLSDPAPRIKRIL